MSNAANNGGLIAKYAGISRIVLQPGDEAGRAQLDALSTRATAYDRTDFTKNVAFDSRLGSALLVHGETASFGNVVIEMLISLHGNDMLATAYRATPEFNAHETYLLARKELIECIEDLLQAEQGCVMVMCPIRKRAASLSDLPLSMLYGAMQTIAEGMKS